jgi:putative ABC transport system permease protein
MRVSSLSTDLIREIGALPYVKSYDYFTNFSLFGMFEHYEPESEDDNMMIGGGWGPSVEENFGESFVMRGVQNPNIMDIEQGLIELVDGRVFTQDEMNHLSPVAVISEEFANLNNLFVGSTMTFRNIMFNIEAEGRMMAGMDEPLTEEDLFASETYIIEVIGIFRPVSLPDMGDPWMTMWAVRDMQNRIYTPNHFAELVLNFANEAWREMRPEMFEDGEEDFIWWENFFTLHDPNEFPEFREAVARVVPPYFHVMDTGGSLRPVLSALDTMRGMTLTVLFVAVGASVLILTLLIMLFLRDRKREVGIYLALGERKGKILSQFLLEITVVAFFSIVVALFVGNIVAGNLSESMLMDDIAAQQEATNDGGWRDWDPFANMGFQTDVPTDVIVDSYDVSLSPFMILLFFGVGFGTILLATVIPMIYVLQLNPKKIML